MKFTKRVDEILTDAVDRKVKFIKKLADPKVWDDAKKIMEDDFKERYDSMSDTDEWAMGMIWEISRKMKKYHNLNSKDFGTIEDLLGIYAYELESRGI